MECSAIFVRHLSIQPDVSPPVHDCTEIACGIKPAFEL
jgi:hypothetical protein